MDGAKKRMRKGVYLSIFILLLGFLGGCGGSREGTNIERVLEGRVVKANGTTPVPGVLIGLIVNSIPEQTAFTDDNGSFEFTLPDPGLDSQLRLQTENLEDTVPLPVEASDPNITKVEVEIRLNASETMIEDVKVTDVDVAEESHSKSSHSATSSSRDPASSSAVSSQEAQPNGFASSSAPTTTSSSAQNQEQSSGTSTFSSTSSQPIPPPNANSSSSPGPNGATASSSAPGQGAFSSSSSSLAPYINSSSMPPGPGIPTPTPPMGPGGGPGAGGGGP